MRDKERETTTTKKEKLRDAIYFSVNVFSTKVLIGDSIFKLSTGDRTAFLLGHPSHAKVSRLQRESCLHFSVILRLSVLVRSRESNPRSSALQSSILPTQADPLCKHQDVPSTCRQICAKRLLSPLRHTCFHLKTTRVLK